MRYFILTAIILICSSAKLKAQDKELIQLSGRVTNELLQPLPFAHILILNNYRGAISNNYGNYSLVVEKNDSLMVSSVGYRGRYFVVPDDITTSFLHMDIVLEIDTLVIDEVVIYPWKDYEEFRRAFVSLDLPMDDIERARRNIAIIRAQIIMDHEPSARTNFRHVMEQQYQQTFIRGQFPSYQIFNPLAWAQFFQALKRGDFKNND